MAEPPPGPSEKAQDQLSCGPDRKFLCGVAINVFQNSGEAWGLSWQPPAHRCPPHLPNRHGLLLQPPRWRALTARPPAGDENSNWGWFEKQQTAHVNIDFRFTGGDLRGIHSCPGFNREALVGVHMEKLGPSVIVKDFRIGVASDFWRLYESDIALAAKLGAQACTCRGAPACRPCLAGYALLLVSALLLRLRPWVRAAKTTGCSAGHQPTVRSSQPCMRRLQLHAPVHRVEPPVPQARRARSKCGGHLQPHVRLPGEVRPHRPGVGGVPAQLRLCRLCRHLCTLRQLRLGARLCLDGRNLRGASRR